MKNKKTAALLCVLCLTLAIFAGCSKDPATESSDPSSPAQSDKPATSSSDISSIPPEESYEMPEPEFGDEKDFEIEVEGQKETVTMTYTELKDSVGSYGSRYFLYVDLERYNCSTFEGEYSITPVGSGENPGCTVKFLPRKGMSAEEAKAEAVERIERLGGTVSGEKETELGGNKALYFETEEGYAYCVEDEGGSLYIGVALISPEANEGHGARIAAMLDTLEIK